MNLQWNSRYAAAHSGILDPFAELTMHPVRSATIYAAYNQPAEPRDAAAERLGRALIERSPAFGSLGDGQQRELATNLVSVARYLAEPAAGLPSQANDFLRAVDFPDFVAQLIDGVFNAIVSASVQQMHAYSDLLKAVTESIDDFIDSNVTDGQARDYLTQKFPEIAPPKNDERDGGDPPDHRRLVAAMLAVGIRAIDSDD